MVGVRLSARVRSEMTPRDNTSSASLHASAAEAERERACETKVGARWDLDSAASKGRDAFKKTDAMAPPSLASVRALELSAARLSAARLGAGGGSETSP